MNYVDIREFDLFRESIDTTFADLRKSIEDQHRSSTQLLEQILQQTQKTNGRVNKLEDFKERTVLDIQDVKHMNSLYQANCPSKKIAEDLNTLNGEVKNYKIAQDNFENSLKVVKFFSEHPSILYIILIMALISPVQNIFTVLMQFIK